MVQDLPLCELAVARGVHDFAARSHLADALDLGHRLAGTWAGRPGGSGHRVGGPQGRPAVAAPGP